MKRNPNAEIKMRLRKAVRLARDLQLASLELQSSLFGTDAPTICFNIADDLVSSSEAVYGLGLTTEKLLNSHTYIKVDNKLMKNVKDL